MLKSAIFQKAAAFSRLREKLVSPLVALKMMAQHITSDRYIDFRTGIPRTAYLLPEEKRE